LGIILLIPFEKKGFYLGKRVRMCVGKRGRGRESQADSQLSLEPDAGLRSSPEPKLRVGCPTHLSHPGAPY